MRRLILKMSISLDGFVAGPHNEGDWIMRSRDDGGRKWVEETLSQAGLHLMGRKTFFDMAGYWPGLTSPLAIRMNDTPKAVFTRQKDLDVSESPGNWAEAEVLAGDLTTEITRLKAQPGKDLLAQGGVSFAQSLVASGLIDEYRFVVHPVVLGKGRALFANLPKPLDFEVRATTVFRSGTVAHVCWPA